MIDRLKRTRRRVLRRWRYRGVHDWVVGPPDFVGVGTQRSGTTWWWQLLCDHPLPRFLTDRAGWSNPQIDVRDAVTETARRIIRSDVAELKTLVPEIDLDLWPSFQAIG
jgi:hypothetical protein